MYLEKIIEKNYNSAAMQGESSVVIPRKPSVNMPSMPSVTGMSGPTGINMKPFVHMPPIRDPKTR
jgi:hypothetical protein